MVVAGGTVSLLNCADEPIHIPGHIQPHGALLAFDGDRLAGWSANAPAMLNLNPAVEKGALAATLGLSAAVIHALADCRSEMVNGEAVPTMLETMILGQEFDCVIHGHLGLIIAEFECREQTPEQIASFALMAHGAIDRIKRQGNIETLLQTAVKHIRKITGFDRVMAYRFRSDESGDVMAEEHLAGLESYLGMRYPASDIPEQARRLYIINTLRFIVDMDYVAVPVIGFSGAAALDMSHSILRSVSPIHVEYLRNMGVGASMSVSIVINGRLWGLIACHHMSRKQVPYSIRMACDVIAQVLASTVQTLEVSAYTQRVEISTGVRTQITEALMRETDVLQILARHAPALAEMLGAQGMIASQFSQQRTSGELTPALAAAIVKSLPHGTGLLEMRVRRTDWPEAIQPLLGKWVGLLAWCFDPATDGWIVALRTEQIESIRWGGQEKDIKPGPLGKRLTPRGSFEEWRETVYDSAESWEAAVVKSATRLASEMHRVSVSRHSEFDMARTQLLAMLGHDLRDPLHTIQMAASIIRRGEDTQKLGRRIFTSSSRMQRLISQIMDMSRINGGLGLGVVAQRTDLVALIQDIVEENNVGYPGVGMNVHAPAFLYATVDADRIAQVLSNLISNARNHGDVNGQIGIVLREDATGVCIEVDNAGQPIQSAVAADLFQPFKQFPTDGKESRRGLGLGLFITHQIILAHKGSISYRYANGRIIFAVVLPPHAEL
jgi:chemotaxis family two-component system sensor kinase Cph1